MILRRTPGPGVARLPATTRRPALPPIGGADMADIAAPTARRAGLRRTLATALAGVLTAALATVTLSATAAQAADCSAGYVGLTYDDGPNPSNTTNLLNTLKANGLR